MNDEEKSPAQDVPAETPEIDTAEVPEELQNEPQQVAAPAYVPRSASAADVKPSRVQKLRDFVTECKRVVRVTKKPSREEYKTIVKISGIGMGIIGLLGFLVHFIKELIF
jgi:protein transport protein SEC61 subunit gamma-like protein